MLLKTTFEICEQKAAYNYYKYGLHISHMIS